MVPKEVQITAKLERLNSGKELTINETFEYTLHDFDTGTEETITFTKAGGIWIRPIESN